MLQGVAPGPPVPYSKNMDREDTRPIQQQEPIMTNALRNKSLQLLAQGFKKDFADKVFQDEKFVDVMHELASKFVEENIPVIDEDDQLDLAFLLLETINVSSF